MSRIGLYFLLLLSPTLSFPATTIGVFADINGEECQPFYPEHSLDSFQLLLRQQRPEHLIMPGDLVHGECLEYGGKLPYLEVVRSMWREFDRQFLRPAAHVGLFPAIAPGNHDAPFLHPKSRDTSRTENSVFRSFWLQKRRFQQGHPVSVPGFSDRYPFFWAYIHRGILFIVLHSTRNEILSDGAEQKRWLRALLRTPAARAARYRIAFGHVPPYPVLDPSVGFKHDSVLHQEQVGNPDSLMDLFFDLGVDLLVFGHSHAPYPAELTRLSDQKKLLLLSMPCAHAARTLFSHSLPAPRGFATIRVSREGRPRISIFEADSGALLPLSFFPAELPVGKGKILYRRVAPALYSSGHSP